MARGLLVYLALCALPALAFLGLARLVRWWSTVDRFDRRAPSVRAPRTYGPSLERIVADLQRLEEEYVRLERSDTPAKVHRMQAVSLAYDDLLVEACRTLELPPPERPLSAVDRVQAQAELSRAGLTW